jgi:hypothetical protein
MAIAIPIGITIMAIMMSNLYTDKDVITGKTFGVYAYKNKNKPRERNFVKNVYTGLKWECVEFVRRFLIVKKKILFNEIDYAYQLWYNFNKNMFFSNDKKFMVIKVPVSDFMHNSFKPGDILIWSPSHSIDIPYGHMAIIVSRVDDTHYKIAEQNWDDEIEWEGEDYSRIINIFTEPFLLGIIKIKIH